MRCHNLSPRSFLVGLLLPMLLSACSTFTQSTEGRDADGQRDLEITIKDAYQGVKDGNVESVPLSQNRIYVTVELCVENLSSTDQSISRQDVFLLTKDNLQIFPSALGYDQAEAFSWALPLAEPLGAKRIESLFYFFLIQGDELMRIPAYQSQGCRSSFQFKSMALLFIVSKEMAGPSYTLHFAGDDVPFTTEKLSLIWIVACIAGFGFFFLLMVILGVVVLRRKSKARTSPLQEKGDKGPDPSDQKTGDP